MTLKIDDTSFQRALAEYASGSSRELPDVLNKVAKDVALTAARVAPRARKEKIDALSNLWKTGNLMWVRKINKLLTESKHGENIKVTKKQLKTLGILMTSGHHKTAEAMAHQIRFEAMSRRILGARKRAIGFIAHAAVLAGRQVDPKTQTPLPRGKGKYKAKGWAAPANIGQGDRPTAKLMMAYEVAHRQGATAIASKAVNEAMKTKAADMKAHIIDRMQKLANQHQGKRR